MRTSIHADLFNLISRDTQLTRKTRDEFHGPCPKCGGTDRFTVNVAEGWWFCRQCSPRRGDAPGYLMWLQNLTYPEALARLGEWE